MSEHCIKVAVPNGVDPDSWLNDDEYKAFRAAYVYATTQSCAVGPLSKLTAEEVHSLYESLKRGEEAFERREAEEARRQKESDEVEAVARVGETWREKGHGRGDKRYTIKLTERIPYWGFYADRDDGPWSLTDRALRDYYERVDA